MRKLLFLCALPLLANDEYKLVDAVIKADRAVERAWVKKDDKIIAKANLKSEIAGAKLTAYCAAQKRTVGVKRSGMLGCLPESVEWLTKEENAARLKGKSAPALHAPMDPKTAVVVKH